jgi:hypothetical protein
MECKHIFSSLLVVTRIDLCGAIDLIDHYLTIPLPGQEIFWKFRPMVGRCRPMKNNPISGGESSLVRPKRLSLKVGKIF